MHLSKGAFDSSYIIVKEIAVFKTKATPTVIFLLH